MVFVTDLPCVTVYPLVAILTVVKCPEGWRGFKAMFFRCFLGGIFGWYYSPLVFQWFLVCFWLVFWTVKAHILSSNILTKLWEMFGRFEVILSDVL